MTGEIEVIDSSAPHVPEPGDVYQINEKHGRAGWIGAFVLVTEVRDTGIQGFVHHIEGHEIPGQIYIRLPFDQLDFIGKATLMPKGLSDAI